MEMDNATQPMANVFAIQITRGKHVQVTFIYNNHYSSTYLYFITEKVCHSEPYLKSSGKWACGIKVSGYMTFKKAFVQCKKRQGKLPMIKSIQEQSILNQIRKNVSDT